MRRSEQIKVLAHKFLLKKYMESKKEKTNFLTLFEKYAEFIREEGVGYGLEAKDLEKEILARFPSVRLDANHNLVGLGPRVYELPPEPDPILKQISRTLSQMINESFAARASGFSVEKLAFFNPDEPLPVEKVEKYLQESESVYWQRGLWHMESRGGW